MVRNLMTANPEELPEKNLWTALSVNQNNTKLSDLQQRRGGHRTVVVGAVWNYTSAVLILCEHL